MLDRVLDSVTLAGSCTRYLSDAAVNFTSLVSNFYNNFTFLFDNFWLRLRTNVGVLIWNTWFWKSVTRNVNHTWYNM